MYQVLISDPAQNDIQVAYEWWRDHRSADEASRWYNMITPAIATLKEMPERCPLAAESDLHPSGLRELHYGIGRRPTHRIVFTIDEETVIVLRVRHSSQARLSPSEIPLDS